MDDPNKLHHLFDNPDHNLDVLIRAYGDKVAAGQAIIDSVDRVYRLGGLVQATSGRYEQAFDVGGYRVTVRGRVVSGIVRIGSAWISGEDAHA